jgi:hypothetical protein
MFDGNGKCGCGIYYVKRCDYIVCFAPLGLTLLLMQFITNGIGYQ